MKSEAHATGRKPTLKTISEISGMAVATVSRALHDAPDLREDTKQLIRQIASEIGYVPNRAGLGLRTGKTNVISLILSTEVDMMNHTAQFISSIAGGLRGTAFHLTVTPFFPDQDPLEPVRYVVETGSADAIILNQTQLSDPRIAYLLEKNFPFAAHGRTNMNLAHPYFDYDNTVFGKIAVRKLARRGCRSILLVSPPTRQTYASHMQEGARTEAQKLGLNFQIEDQTDSDQPNQVIQQSIEHRLRETPSIDGFIGASAPATIAIVGALEAVDRQVGQDAHVATKEPTDLMKLFRKDIIVLREDVSRAGMFLAKAAIQAIRHPEKSPLQDLEIPEDDGI